ncbi:WDR61 isoform 14, partial [Pan troglodytes]
LLHTLEGHAMPIRSLTFSPDSQLLVTASDDGYIKIYDVCRFLLLSSPTPHASASSLLGAGKLTKHGKLQQCS